MHLAVYLSIIVLLWENVCVRKCVHCACIRVSVCECVCTIVHLWKSEGNFQKQVLLLGSRLQTQVGSFHHKQPYKLSPSSGFGSPLKYVRLESSSQTEMRSVIIYIFVKTTSQYRKSCAHNSLEISSDALSIEKLE